MDEEKMARAQAHAIALEQNQMALHKRIADLQGQLQATRAELAASVLREAELQTQVNEAVEALGQLVAGHDDQYRLAATAGGTHEQRIERARAVLAKATAAQP